MTYNDLPSGIFSSQVIDVVKFFNYELNVKVKLVSFISLRNYLANRKKIKNQLSESIVLPMFPGFHRWRQNLFLLTLISFIKKPDAIIGRSVLATQLALSLKKSKLLKKVIYDGRGAITAEWKEYQVVENPKLLADIFNLEKEVILNSDFRIAVSEQLVNYWEKEFNYQEINHVIIPCTLNKVFENVIVSPNTIEKSRRLLGLNKEDISFIYSGSVARWQSFNLLYDFMKPKLVYNNNIKLIFLAKKNDFINKIVEEFKGRVFCFNVNPNDVPDYLIGANYGILIRENRITNQVASPVKFAEYLCCGLPVIISEKLGDYSEFVTKNKCGYLLNKFQIETINKSTIHKVAIDNFTKYTFFYSYKKIVDYINK